MSKVSPRLYDIDSIQDNILLKNDDNLKTKEKASTVTDDPVDLARELIKDDIYFQIFVFISSLVSVLECIVVGFSPINFTTNGFIFRFQLIILIVSTALFWIGIYMIARAMNKLPDKPIESFFEAMYESFDGEVVVEFICLLFGWCTIFILPGLAVLRCFRIYRFLWYFELFNQKEGSYVYKMLTKSCQLSIESLEMIGEELFTTNSNGGAVVLGLYFFTSYIFAVVYHTSLGDLNTLEGTTCSTLVNCFVVMLRLSFYDDITSYYLIGTGFDFLTAVIDSKFGGFAVLLIIYLCFSAMILLNGLIGIFGMAFQKPESGEDNGPSNQDILDEIKSMRAQMNHEINKLKRDVENIRNTRII